LKTPLKIAIYTGAVPPIESFINRLVEGLAQSGHQVYLFGKRRTAYRPAHENIKLFPSARTAPGRWWQLWRNYWQLRLYAPADWRKLRDHIRREYPKANWRQRNALWSQYLPVLLHRPDIFHLQWAKAIEKWHFLSPLFGIKVVLSLRGAHINYSPLVDPQLAAAYRRYLPEVDGFHAVSEHIGREAQTYGARPERIRVCYSGLPQNIVEGDYPPLRKRAPGAPLRVLSIGRDHWKKGYLYALDAVQLLRERGLPVQYEMILSTGAREELIYHRHDLGLEDRVTFLPKMPNREVMRKLAATDLFLLPSLSEGIANVVLEAMAAGRPVVSTDCGGMPELIDDGRNGFLVPVRNARALADRIEQVAALPQAQLERIARAAHQTIRERHTVDSLVVSMNALYWEVLQVASGSGQTHPSQLSGKAGLNLTTVENHDQQT